MPGGWTAGALDARNSVGLPDEEIPVLSDRGPVGLPLAVKTCDDNSFLRGH